MILKLILSISLVLSSLIGIYTMFEIFGKTERRKSMELLKKIHRLNGRVFFMIFLIGAGFCLYLLSQSKAELTPRASIHAFSAVAIFLLFSLKIAFVKYYRQFYSYGKLIGVVIALLSFNLIAFSTGYSLVTGDMKQDIKISEEQLNLIAKFDKGNPENGKRLFDNLCASCHYSDRKDFKRAAPGLKGILTEKTLPVSKKPATVENVVNQLRKPYKYMPSFSDLPHSDIADIVAYLKKL